jgi:excisionase family DNA binding protein
LAETVLTLPQAAAVLAVDAATVGRYVRAGRLEGVRVGGRWKTSREAVARFLAGTQPRAKADPPARTPAGRRGEKALARLRAMGVKV